MAITYKKNMGIINYSNISIPYEGTIQSFISAFIGDIVSIYQIFN